MCNNTISPTNSEHIPRPTNEVADTFVYSAVGIFEHTHRRAQRDRMGAPLLANQRRAGNKPIASLISNGHAPEL